MSDEDDQARVDPLADCYHPPYAEVWLCPQPDSGIRYQVLRDEWNEDFSVRTIHEIRVMR